MKRAVLLILTAVLLLSLFSCGGSGNEKDSMNKLDRIDLGFVCYYDQSWLIAENDDKVLLQAPAKADGVTNESISIRTAEFDGSASEYVSFFDENNGLDDYILKKNVKAEVGGKDGVNFVFVYTVSGTLCRACNYAVEANGTIYVLTYCTPEESYDVDTKAISAIVKYIEFVDITPSESSQIEYNGGKVESVNEDFRFDYPSGWGVVRHDGLISVCRNDSNVSVTVQAFSLPTEKSSYGVNKYWEEYEAELKNTYKGYGLIDGHAEEEYKLGKAPACRKDYSLTFDGGKYVYTQVIAIADGYVFSVVYCGNEAEYASYLADFDSMISSFELD